MTNTTLTKRVGHLEKQATMRRIGKALAGMDAADVQAVATMVDDRFKALTGRSVWEDDHPAVLEPLTDEQRLERLEALRARVLARAQGEARAVRVHGCCKVFSSLWGWGLLRSH